MIRQNGICKITFFSIVFVKCIPYYIFDDRVYCVSRRQLSKIGVSAIYGTVSTLRTRDISALSVVPKCPDSSAPVPKCLAEEMYNITGYYYQSGPLVYTRIHRRGLATIHIQ